MVRKAIGSTSVTGRGLDCSKAASSVTPSWTGNDIFIRNEENKLFQKKNATMTTSFLSTVAHASLMLTKKRFLIRVVNIRTINLVLGMNSSNILIRFD
jgi:hypothetical protein